MGDDLCLSRSSEGEQSCSLNINFYSLRISQFRDVYDQFNQRSEFPFEKLILFQLPNSSLYLMKAKISLLYSEKYESILHLPVAFKVHFNISLLFMDASYSRSVFFRFFHQNHVVIFYFRHSFHVLRPF